MGNEVKEEPELITSFEKLEKEKKLKENAPDGINNASESKFANYETNNTVGNMDLKTPQMSKKPENDYEDAISDTKVKDFINSVMVLILILIFISIVTFVALSYTGRLQILENPMLKDLLSNFSF